jgi:D-arabinose 1-dehydrogenase-like Zn-dependent alcohol dehydrogenase
VSGSVDPQDIGHLATANEALQRLRDGKIEGAAVLVPR